MASIKINITVKEDLLSRIDEYADTNGMTRSGFFGIASKAYLDSMELTPVMKQLFQSLGDVVAKTASGEISESDALSQLSNIQTQTDSVKARISGE